MNQSKFALSEFENRNGKRSWRVDGYFKGVRIRRNFKSRKDAAAEKSILEIKALQNDRGLFHVATKLTPQQVQEAEFAFQRVAGKSHSLQFYLDYALTNYLEPDQQKSMPKAVAAYVASKEFEYEQDHIRYPQLIKIKQHLGLLIQGFEGKTVAEVTGPQLIAFLEKRRISMKSFNNYRGSFGTFFKFCFHRGWTRENPILKFPAFRLRQRRGMAKTLTAATARELMEFLETHQGGQWVPYYALCLFAGIRPGVPEGEIAKLSPEDVRLENGLIYIRPEVSKVREPRRITIQPNLAAWLRAYPLDKHPIVIGDFHKRKRREKFKERFGLTHDVLRHTFISMFVAKYRSIGEAAIQAGNSEHIIRRHYLDLKAPEEAEAFYAIFPKISKLNSQQLFPAANQTPSGPNQMNAQQLT